MNEQYHYKFDKDKIQLDLLFSGVPNAIMEIGKVFDYGAKKYKPHSWKNVEKLRYENAYLRHLLLRKLGEKYDKESNILHLAHEISNLLFILEMELKENECKI